MLLFEELVDANRLIRRAQETNLAQEWVRHRVLAEVPYKRSRYPLLAFEFGLEQAPLDAPLFILVGGVHGLERIGAQVVLSQLTTLIERMHWDIHFRERFRALRLVAIPFVNPVGILRQTRSNGNGVDLMRNAPIDALGKTSFMVGGQRISRHLPWYRGEAGSPMQLEAQTVCDAIEAYKSRSRFTLLLDVHSGFGLQDQIWFPYAKTTEVFPHQSSVWNLKALFETTYPFNKYRFEPQSLHYTTHGDLWDYLYDRHFGVAHSDWKLSPAAHRKPGFLPLTLEMGSWAWVRKNPRQLFSALGPFNPIQPHRRARILRRHLPFLDFLLGATSAWERWR